jgi:hypothetical protein
MKKYIREMLDDLKKGGPKPAKTIDLNVPPAPVVPQDLENQELSSDPAQRVRQLDYQAQEDEERESLG